MSIHNLTEEKLNSLIEGYRNMSSSDIKAKSMLTHLLDEKDKRMTGYYDITKKACHCHDGSLVPIWAIRNNCKKWELYGISVVHGQGDADHNNKIIPDEFDEVIALNSFSGKSYIVLRKDTKWGLIELKDNSTAQCEWKIISNFVHESYNDLLTDMQINKASSTFFIE